MAQGGPAAARALLLQASLVAVPVPVFCEFAWVLKRTYARSAAEIATAIEAFTALEVIATDLPAVEAGLVALRAGGLCPRADGPAVRVRNKRAGALRRHTAPAPLADRLAAHAEEVSSRSCNARSPWPYRSQVHPDVAVTASCHVGTELPDLET